MRKIMKNLFWILGFLGISQIQACENWTDEFMTAVHSNMANALKILEDHSDVSFNPAELVDLSREILLAIEKNSNEAQKINDLLKTRGITLSEDMDFDVLFPQTP